MKNLTEKALLVSLTVSQWSARKYDRKITEEINTNHNSKNAGRFNKLLIANEHIQAITKVGTMARTFHYENTLPWNDSGERLLPTENYFEYTSKLSEIKQQFETEVRKFINAYPDLIEEAKQNLNGLFNANDYPLNIEDKFGIRIGFMPVPETQDIRVNLSDYEVSVIKESIEKEVSDRFVNAQRDIYERISKHLTYMAERLKEKDSIFRDSLFDNILSLVDLIPRLNIANDEGIAELCKDLKSLYCDPETVRTSKKKRADKAQEVNNMLSKLNGFLIPA